jgi:sorbitol-specific phosphotransferase system component IIBC
MREVAEKQVVGNLTLNIVWLCGGTTADITPAQPLKFNMDQACEKIKKQHVKIRVKSPMLLMFDYMKMEISLFDGGRMLIKNVTDNKLPMKAFVEILKTINVPV